MRIPACLSACVVAGAVGGAWPGTVGAQAPQVVPCNGQRIDALRIVSVAPSVAGVQRIPVVSGVARQLHVTTRPSVIEGFLLLHVGDRCSELRRAESERILRAQPFIADATVQAVKNDVGGVDLEVHTIDEVEVVFSATVRAKMPLLSQLRMGSANVNGEGIYAVGSWWHEPAFRDGLSIGVTDYQMFGRPYQGTVQASRNPLGGSFHVGLQRPFLTDLQRTAWRAQQGKAVDYVRFVDPTGAVHAMRAERAYSDIGGLVRIGPPGRLLLLGMSVSHEGEHPGAAPLLLSSSGVAPDSSGEFAGRYTGHSVSRLNALVGYRNLRYVRTTGLDALRNTQDVPVGIQAGALIGKSASFLGSADQDMLVGTDIYAGWASARSGLRFQASGEARRSFNGPAWDGVLGSGRLAQFQRVGESQMLMGSLEWSGGWRVRVPFRMTLAGVDGGIRGMSEGREQGGRRAIMRVEDRIDLGAPWGSTADIGMALFADAGRLWAGDVPYGVSTPLRYAVGFSLLAAVPSRSARMWRLDVAFPRVPGRGVRVAFRLSRSDQSTVFWRDPRDLRRARERSVPASLFNWP